MNVPEPLSLRGARRRSNLNPQDGGLLRYARNDMRYPFSCHCEERSDEAISILVSEDCFTTRAMTCDARSWHCGLRMSDRGLAPTVSGNPPSAMRHPKLSRGRRAGVTLTEVVVASVLLLICIAPLLKALTAAQVMDRAIERRSWSLMLAQERLEWVRARSIHHYDDCCSTSSAAMRDGYLCTIADDGHPKLKTVTVSVGLDQNEDGVLSQHETEVSLSTRLAKGGLGS